MGPTQDVPGIKGVVLLGGGDIHRIRRGCTREHIGGSGSHPRCAGIKGMVILGEGGIHRIRHGYTWEHIGGSSHTGDTQKRYSILGDMWELPRTVLGWALGSCICLQWGTGSALGLSLGTALPFTLTRSGNPSSLYRSPW